MKISKIIAVVMFAGATAAVWMWPRAEAPEPAEMPVRPVRSIVVGDCQSMPEMRFSGIVKANARRTLSFKESGRIERIPVKNGQKIKKGEKIAWLFDGDFTNRVENCRAAAERDRLTFKRIQDAAKKNAVSKEELSKAETQLRQSEAQLALAERALRATVIYAPFDCVVAKWIATELEVVSGTDPIVEIQDLSDIKIDVAVPESLVIIQRQVKYDASSICRVIFDSLPEQTYPIEFVEFTTRADEKSQTFTATYRMKYPEELVVLPGMSATVIVPADCSRRTAEAGKKSVSIPGCAVGIDGQGGYFAWVLEATGEKDGDKPIYCARKRSLGGCAPEGGMMSVGEGLKPGDRIATAGIAVLTEGRKVRSL